MTRVPRRFLVPKAVLKTVSEKLGVARQVCEAGVRRHAAAVTATRRALRWQ